MTLGVLHRVEELADRDSDFMPKDAVPFKKLMPLSELIAAYLKTEVFGKKVWEIYNKLIQQFGNEFNVLLNAEKNDLSKIVDEKLAELIINNRAGQIKFVAGYDGVYGKPVIDENQKENHFATRTQKNLGEFLTK